MHTTMFDAPFHVQPMIIGNNARGGHEVQCTVAPEVMQGKDAVHVKSSGPRH